MRDYKDKEKIVWHNHKGGGKTMAVVREITETTDRYLEMMAAAYLKETKIPATEVELIQQLSGEGVIRWYFRRREDINNNKETL